MHSGGFQNVEDVLLDALEFQNVREDWLLKNRGEIHAKIEQGLAELDRGEGIPCDELRSRLEADTAAWLADRNDS